MIFNCLNCGISISTKCERCAYCRTDNSEIIGTLTGIKKSPQTSENITWREKFKGTILSYVLH